VPAEFSRAIDIPVLGIIDAGVDLFYQALSSNPSSSIVLMGTRTTIESQVHRDRLVHKGIEAGRIVAVHCHGLAAAIEKDPDSSATGDLIQNCVSEACRAGLTGMPVYVGLCCTHYTYVADSIGASFERQSGQSIRILDPGHRLACCVAPVQEDVPAPGSAISVEVVSKVELYDRQRHAIAKRVESVSAITARALLSYARTPDLF
jgi:glutamate racemase